MTCKECGSAVTPISKHLLQHGISLEEYVIKYDHGGARPTCGCGCLGKVTFRRGVFKRFMHGHASNDPKIRAFMVEAGRAAANDPEKRKKNSEAVKKRWAEDLSYGQRIHSNENYRRRIAASRVKTTTPEFKEKMRHLKQVQWNDNEWAERQRMIFSSDSFRKKVSMATERALSTPEMRAELSTIARKAFVESRRRPKSNWSNIKSGWYQDPFHPERKLWFDSGWEHEFMVMCFSAGIECVRDPFIIPYIGSNGLSASYQPDFLVAGAMIIEIKGQEFEYDRIKYRAGMAYASALGLSYIVLRGKKALKGFIDATATHRVH